MGGVQKLASRPPRKKTPARGKGRAGSLGAKANVIANLPDIRRTRGRQVKKTVKYLEAEQAGLLDDVDGEEESETGGGAPEDAEKSGIKLKINLKPRLSQTPCPTAPGEYPSSNGTIEYDSTFHGAVPRGQSVLAPINFVDTIDQEVIDLYNLIALDEEIQTMLPSLTQPNPDPALAESEDFDINHPYTAKKLFHLYILAYSRDSYNICDLVADIWIREFQRIDSNPKLKIWQPNLSDHLAHQIKTAPQNDNGEPYLDHNVTAFDHQRLTELYENTYEGCGGRAVWADAMALCGSWLRVRMGRTGMDKQSFHPGLMWDVLHTSLGHLRKARVTAKIEEKNPSEWCKRYHEHRKHGAECYRDVHRQQEKANKENAAAASNDGNEGDMMEVDDIQGAKHVSFASVSNTDMRE